MAKEKKNSVKKEMQSYILESLEKTFDKIKEGMTEKKFRQNIKKASKMILADFKVEKPKKIKVKKADITG